MQEIEIDYYEIDTWGCCLHCPNSYPGCLCYDCKCKKCYWYSSPEEYDGKKGHCDKTDELIKERKEEIKKRGLKKIKILAENNNKTLLYLKNKNEIPNWYTCQNCKMLFVSEEEHKIILNKLPICGVCI